MKERRGTSPIRDEIRATTQAVVAADEARLGAGAEGVRWRRLGPLQRLTQVERV